MNEVLVALWYIMGLWPLVYSMLLIPTGRSSKTKIPVWPFLVLSCVGGAYALIPYFVLWKPPPPPVSEDEVNRWPLNFLESRITAGVTLAAGLGLIAYAGFAGEDNWREFYQYLRESKFIHVTCIDFSLLYAFSPFWVYNDMTARRWMRKGSWLLPLALIPFVVPSKIEDLRSHRGSLLAAANEEMHLLLDAKTCFRRSCHVESELRPVGARALLFGRGWWSPTSRQVKRERSPSLRHRKSNISPTRNSSTFTSSTVKFHLFSYS
uniref:Cardiolipin synthase N-terminal domain-containing protein n=1 Tax=Ananas comosus var. bracteatus TaxID=296719 RepID=A0A6V7P1K2_ANACO|nr:unnamed protein product [Ananas comosus var. bracteatus]